MTHLLSFLLFIYGDYSFNDTFKFVYGDYSFSHMTHLLSFLLFILLFHTESPLLIETLLLRSYVFYFIYGGLHNFHLILLNLLF